MITEDQFKHAASLIGCKVSCIKAVYSVEAAGRGYLTDGRVKILFEGHRFWKQISMAGINPIDFLQEIKNEGYRMNGKLPGSGAAMIVQYEYFKNVLYPIWDKKNYKGGAAEWDRMSKAMEVCKLLSLQPELAMDSASYGSFQIMGENAELCGYKSAHEMIAAYNNGGESEQLNSFVRFVKSTKLDDELRALDFAAFARGYNGSQYRLNKYDIKLHDAYKKFEKLS